MFNKVTVKIPVTHFYLSWLYFCSCWCGCSPEHHCPLLSIPLLYSQHSLQYSAKACNTGRHKQSQTHRLLLSHSCSDGCNDVSCNNVHTTTFHIKVKQNAYQTKGIDSDVCVYTGLSDSCGNLCPCDHAMWCAYTLCDLLVWGVTCDLWPT